MDINERRKLEIIANDAGLAAADRQAAADLIAEPIADEGAEAAAAAEAAAGEKS